MKVSLPPKLVEKLVWVPTIISFGKIFIPSYGFDAILCQNWPFSPPNRSTLWITLLFSLIFKLFNALDIQYMFFPNLIFVFLDFNHFLSWIFYLLQCTYHPTICSSFKTSLPPHTRNSRFHSFQFPPLFYFLNMEGIIKLSTKIVKPKSRTLNFIETEDDSQYGGSDNDMKII